MNKNVLKTAVMMGGLGGALVLIGSLVGGARGASIFLVISLAMIFGSYWFSDKLAIKSAGAREVSEVDAPRLYATVRDLTERATTTEAIPVPTTESHDTTTTTSAHTRPKGPTTTFKSSGPVE